MEVIWKQVGSLGILAGDFNYNLFNLSHDHHVTSFWNLLTSYSFLPTISRATRAQNDRYSLLDNIFINKMERFKQSGIILDDLSDHFPIFLSLALEIERAERPPMIQVFDHNRYWDLNDFLSYKLHSFNTIKDANQACEVLINAYTEGINKFSRTIKPARKKKSTKTMDKSCYIVFNKQQNKIVPQIFEKEDSSK